MYPELIPESFYLKYNPPKIGISYHLSSNPKNPLMHEITVFLKNNATPKGIVDELYNHESFYFKNVDKVQTMKLVKQLIDNSKIPNSTKKEVKENKPEINKTSTSINKPPSKIQTNNIAKSSKPLKSPTEKEDEINSNDIKAQPPSNLKKEKKRSLRERMGLGSQINEDEDIESQKTDNLNEMNMKKSPKEEKSLKNQIHENKSPSKIEETKKEQKSKKSTFEKRKEVVDFNEAKIYDPDDINTSVHGSEKNEGQINQQQQINNPNNILGENFPTNENSESENAGMNEYDGYPPLQKVFFEELNQELLIDPDGNLFDLEGQYVGSLGVDEEEGEEGEETYEEDEEMESELPPPKMQKGMGKLNNPKEAKVKPGQNKNSKVNKKMGNPISQQIQREEEIEEMDF